jgi:hypothetical protein
MLGLVMTDEQDFAALFLETQGKRFCIDFGYENAVKIAETYSGYNRPKFVM